MLFVFVLSDSMWYDSYIASKCFFHMHSQMILCRCVYSLCVGCVTLLFCRSNEEMPQIKRKTEANSLELERIYCRHRREKTQRTVCFLIFPHINVCTWLLCLAFAWHSQMKHCFFQSNNIQFCRSTMRELRGIWFSTCDCEMACSQLVMWMRLFGPVPLRNSARPSSTAGNKYLFASGKATQVTIQQYPWRTSLLATHVWNSM